MKASKEVLVSELGVLVGLACALIGLYFNLQNNFVHTYLVVGGLTLFIASFFVLTYYGHPGSTGARLRPISSSVAVSGYCTSCGQMLWSTDAFCPRCGAKASESLTQPPPLFYSSVEDGITFSEWGAAIAAILTVVYAHNYVTQMSAVELFVVILWGGSSALELIIVSSLRSSG